MTMKKPIKKTQKTEPLEVIENVITESIEIDTSYQTLAVGPVPASAHVANQHSHATTFPKPRFEKLLPIVSTILVAVVLGATILAVGIFIGKGF